MTELAREVHIGYHVYKILRTLAVFDECLDRDHVQAMLLGKLQQFRRTHHMSIIIHDLTAETSRIETCQPCEIRRRLRMASPAQYTALNRTQREYMTRTAEAGRLGLRIQKLLHRLAALKG